MTIRKHCEAKLPLTIQDVRGIWADLPDGVRLEVLKSVIWTAPNPVAFLAKVSRLLKSEKFYNDID